MATTATLRVHRILVDNVERCDQGTNEILVVSHAVCDRLRAALEDVGKLTKSRYKNLLQTHSCEDCAGEYANLAVVPALLRSLAIDHESWWEDFLGTLPRGRPRLAPAVGTRVGDGAINDNAGSSADSAPVVLAAAIAVMDPSSSTDSMAGGIAPSASEGHGRVGRIVLGAAQRRRQLHQLLEMKRLRQANTRLHKQLRSAKASEQKLRLQLMKYNFKKGKREV